MSKRWVWTLAVALLAGTALAAAVQTMSVQIRNGQIRSSPSFLGTVVATVNYGDRLEVTGQQGVWTQVKSAAGAAGWIHQSALTTKRIVMSAGSENVRTGASGEELALAGKGFNPEVEAQFKAQNRQIRFEPVDRMERQKVTADEMKAFLREGQLGGQTR
jgi:SH3-like domain-containing protein